MKDLSPKEYWDLPIYMSNRIRADETKTDFFYNFDEENKILYINFEQTREWEDWAYNFLAWTTMYDGRFKIHYGFAKCYLAIRPHLHKMYNELDPDTVVLTGYSHGGPLSILAHEDIKYAFSDIEVKTCIFGSPRVLLYDNALPGTQDFIERTDDIIRVQYMGDFISHLGPSFAGWRHVGTLCQIGEDVGIGHDIKTLIFGKAFDTHHAAYFTHLYGYLHVIDTDGTLLRKPYGSLTLPKQRK